MYTTFFRPNELIAQQVQDSRADAARRHARQIEPEPAVPVQRRSRRWHHGEVISLPRLHAVR